jgi:hypothetical protein
MTKNLVRKLLQTKRAPSWKKTEATRREVGSIRRAMGQQAAGVTIRATARRPQEKLKNIKSSARQGELVSTKNPHAPNPNGAKDEKSGGCKESEVIDDKDNCGAAGMQ